jgi:hypothetical protein
VTSRTPREEALQELRPIDEHHTGLTRAIEKLVVAVVNEVVEQNRPAEKPWEKALEDSRRGS